MNIAGKKLWQKLLDYDELLNEFSKNLCYEGWQYQYGSGVKKDLSEAADDYGNGEGLFWTGFCYNWGIGIEKDEQKAFTYYLKSAEAGYPNGIYKTSICYKFGIGVKANEDKHMEWYNKDFLKLTYYYVNRTEKNKM